MGWQEVAPTGLPSDAGTDPDEWETTASPLHPREEVRCWVRGDRYVRICRVNPRDDVRTKARENPWAVHVGWINNLGSDKPECFLNEYDKAVGHAYRLMRIGGGY
jgi:hypothetical protein